MTIPKIIEKYKGAIVLVDVQIPVENNQKKISIKGTGFLISPDGMFVTNAHVYRAIQKDEEQYAEASVPRASDRNGIVQYEQYPIQLVSIDDENDVAVMRIVSNRKDFPAIPLPKKAQDVEEGHELIYSGYPLAIELLHMGFGITMTTNRAMVSSVKRRGSDGSFHFFLIDGHINSGSSGSPVFSTKTGKVIGIASAKISAKIPIPGGAIADIPANMGICRPIEYAMKLVNKN